MPSPKGGIFFVVFVSVSVFAFIYVFSQRFLLAFVFFVITFAAAKNKTLCIVHTLAANSMPLT